MVPGCCASVDGADVFSVTNIGLSTEITAFMNRLYKKYVAEGIPVGIGEFGSRDKGGYDKITGEQFGGTPMIGELIMFFPLFLVYGLLPWIGLAKTITKAGEKWWKLLIPVYGSYVPCKVAGCRWVFWIGLLVGGAAGAVLIMMLALEIFYIQRGDYMEFSEETFIELSSILAVCAIVLAVLWIVFCFRMAKSFGRGKVFGAGLILFPMIFWMILGFSGMAYAGTPRRARDGIADYIEDTPIAQDFDDVHDAPARRSFLRRRGWRCSGCGAENDHNELYCQNCGMRMP